MNMLIYWLHQDLVSCMLSFNFRAMFVTVSCHRPRLSKPCLAWVWWQRPARQESHAWLNRGYSHSQVQLGSWWQEGMLPVAPRAAEKTVQTDERVSSNQDIKVQVWASWWDKKKGSMWGRLCAFYDAWNKRFSSTHTEVWQVNTTCAESWNRGRTLAESWSNPNSL